MFGGRFFGRHFFGARYWGSGGSGTPPEPPVVIIDTGGGGGEYHEHKNKKYKDERDRLKRVVRDAFRKITGEPEPAPVTRRVERKIATAAIKQWQSEIKLNGLPEIKAALSDINALIRDYESLRLEQEERITNDNDAIAILLLVA